MFNYSLLVSAIVFVCLDSAYLNYMKDYLNKQVQSVQGTKIQFNLFFSTSFKTFISDEIITLPHEK